jgi:hypothetical protein
MIGKVQPRRFGHHALAVLAAAMVGSTAFSLIWTTAAAVATGDRIPGLTWLVSMAVFSWLGVFIITLPSAGIVLSLLWPVTRRGTMAATWICILAGATIGIILAPLASPKLHGTTLLQLTIFMITGAAVAASYLVIANRLSRGAQPAKKPFADFSRQLQPSETICRQSQNMSNTSTPTDREIFDYLADSHAYWSEKSAVTLNFDSIDEVGSLIEAIRDSQEIARKDFTEARESFRSSDAIGIAMQVRSLGSLRVKLEAIWNVYHKQSE